MAQRPKPTKAKTNTRARGKPLAEYAGKRDFARTPEPKPEAAGAATGEFVVQKHAARRLHYDLRLELDGMLKSWAVTRGPSLTLGEKRLAVRTEDHPIEYLDFEGNIPKGEYGGGIDDRVGSRRWRPEVDPHKGLEEGASRRSRSTARGCKAVWHLVRMRPRRRREDRALAAHEGRRRVRPPARRARNHR